MKKLSIILSLVLLAFAACKNEQAETATTETQTPQTATPAQQAESQSIAILASKEEFLKLSPSIEKSTIQWTATKAGGGGHTGTFKLLDGSFHIIRGNLKQGSFTINMGSVEVTDLTGSDKADLEGHLKDADFFETTKFPTAQFDLTGILFPEQPDANITHLLTGNLTIKGITKEIKFPAHLEVQGDNVIVTSPEFSINRTDWGIKYHSGLVGTVKDKIINDEVKLKLNVVVPITVG